ncbi:MAG TPA: VOC family protein [Mucilaginibacter sp.]|jgi:catechol 2,3-dioxygenase-like lactoylglutathione lyase family enzyme|nr:VOC family protein [Mucilaginibacter sp.]
MASLNLIAPFFIVEDLQTSVTFYVDKLGFEIQFIGPEGDPYFAIVGRDKVWINLKAITPEIKPAPNHTRHEWARWDAYISTDDPETLFKEYSSKGVVFHQPLMVNSDNLLGFEIDDADGYRLFFGRPNTD